MKLLERYLVHHFTWPLLLCLFLFLGMFIMIDCLNNLDDFLSNSVSLTVIAAYYGAMLPIIISQVLPSAVMIAALYTLSTLNKSSEIPAMKASGISGYHILLPLLFMGLLISFCLLAMNETITPKSAITSTSIKQGLIQKKGTNLNERAIENVALLGSNNRMIYAQELLLATHSLFNVIILDHRADLSLQKKTMAQRGVYEKGHWTLYDVTEYETDSEGNMTSNPMHSVKKSYPEITQSPQEFLRQNTQSEFMGFGQLLDYIQKTGNMNTINRKRLLTDLHRKLATPFTCFIILLVSAPFGLRTRRGGAMVSIGVGLFIIVIYYSLTAFFIALGKGGIVDPITAAWFPNALFFCVGAILLRKYI